MVEAKTQNKFDYTPELAYVNAYIKRKIRETGENVLELSFFTLAKFSDTNPELYMDEIRNKGYELTVVEKVHSAYCDEYSDMQKYMVIRW